MEIVWWTLEKKSQATIFLNDWTTVDPFEGCVVFVTRQEKMASQDVSQVLPRGAKNVQPLQPQQQKKKRIAIDGIFLAKLRRLLKIVMPSWNSKPALLLAMHTTFLLARTFVSILVARLDGALVKAIVDRNGRRFAIEMAKWLTLAWPACYINSMIKFLEGKVALAFRTKLTEHSLQKYCQDDCHYRVSNLDGRLANADQCLTQDISAFTTSLAHLWSHLSKPAFDVALISFELLRHNRSRGHNGSCASLFFSFFFMPSFILFFFVHCHDFCCSFFFASVSITFPAPIEFWDACCRCC